MLPLEAEGICVISIYIYIYAMCSLLKAFITQTVVVVVVDTQNEFSSLEK